MTIDSTCPLYDAYEENYLYLFKDCNIIAHFWHVLMGRGASNAFLSLDLDERLLHKFRGVVHNTMHVNRCGFFASSLWVIQRL